MTADRLFLLSPANSAGPRGQLLLASQGFELAQRLRGECGAPLGEVFSFISGLYFRGKLAYARRFGTGSALVITPTRGLLPPDTPLTAHDLAEFARVPIDANEPRFTDPLARDLGIVARQHAGDVVLLGSIASTKYTAPLAAALGDRLVFPSTFVGRGDMSRGAVMLRAVEAGVELEYEPVAGAIVRGTRPPRLAKRRE